MSFTVTTTPARDLIFEQCFNITVGQEGALSTDRNDRGNWTSGQVGVGIFKGSKFGVSAMSFPDLDIANLTIAQVMYPIYYPKYYTAVHCDEVPGPLACLMFDASVNNGQGVPVHWVQQALGTVLVDGKWGPITKAAVNGYHGNGMKLLSKFQAIRLRYMADLSNWKHNPGWADRLFDVAYAAQGVK